MSRRGVVAPWREYMCRSRALLASNVARNSRQTSSREEELINITERRFRSIARLQFAQICN